MDIVIAGIIDTRTGVITDTLTKQKGKRELRLKVRDELNVEHGKNAFMSIEFSSIGNVDYIKRHMVSDPALTHELDVLHCHYKIGEINKYISRKEGEIVIAKCAITDCRELLASEPAKLEFIVNAVGGGISELEDELGSFKCSKNYLTRSLKNLMQNVNRKTIQCNDTFRAVTGGDIFIDCGELARR